MTYTYKNSLDAQVHKVKITSVTVLLIYDDLFLSVAMKGPFFYNAMSSSTLNISYRYIQETAHLLKEEMT